MKYCIIISLLLVSVTVFSQQIRLDHRASDKVVIVTADGKPFTSFYYPGADLIKKPVLYPVYSPGGNLLTRGWPLNPREGERVDHPHHIGIWFNYEDVNGNDFWNNSPQVNRPGRRFGTISNTRILSTSGGANRGTLTASSEWVDHDGKLLLNDTTKILFEAKEKSLFTINYEVILVAAEDVNFRDVKDGMFAFRLARELELKYDKPETLTGADGKAMSDKVVRNEKVSGSYLNKEGVTNDDVWGKSSAWCHMTGTVNNEIVTVGIIDHPSNFGYPGYWHARGYGLFALNSVARQAYDKTAEALRFSLKKGESATFRYRVVVASQALTDQQMSDLSDEFGASK